MTRLITKIHNLSQVSDALFKSHKIGLLPRHAMVMHAIYELKQSGHTKDGGPCQQEVAKYASIDRSTMTPIMRNLYRKKLISKRRGSLDSRMWILNLTEKGEYMIPVIKETIIKVERELVRVMKEDRYFIDSDFGV